MPITTPQPDDKKCPKCLSIKPLSDFYSAGKKTSSWCKKCRIKDNAIRREKYPERRLSQDLKKQYGINLEEYFRLLFIQRGVCGICGSPPTFGRTGRLFVDHNHQTGEVRGLLCSRCNTGIGLLMDSVENLEKAIRYLKGEHDRVTA